MYGLATFLNDLSKKSTDKQEGQNKFQRNFKKFLKKEKKINNWIYKNENEAQSSKRQ